MEPLDRSVDVSKFLCSISSLFSEVRHAYIQLIGNARPCLERNSLPVNDSFGRANRGIFLREYFDWITSGKQYRRPMIATR